MEQQHRNRATEQRPKEVGHGTKTKCGPLKKRCTKHNRKKSTLALEVGKDMRQTTLTSVIVLEVCEVAVRKDDEEAHVFFVLAWQFLMRAQSECTPLFHFPCCQLSSPYTLAFFVGLLHSYALGPVSPQFQHFPFPFPSPSTSPSPFPL